jgi:hypothetical protein
MRKYDYYHGPANASKSHLETESSLIEAQPHESRVKSNLDEHNTDRLSYYQLVVQREKQEDFKKIMILKQVIRENVKRKN